MIGRFQAKRVFKILLIFILSCMIINIISKHSAPEMNYDALLQKEELNAMERIKLRKLHEYQQVVFKNNNKPGNNVYNINVTKAETMPLYREIPDTRPQGCAAIKYHRSSLPTLSIIIPFYNEALVMVLRTVHSILERTPSQLLTEIILVNDHSTNSDINERLPKYVKLLPEKVKLIRMSERVGLIRARMTGAHLARGDVIMFQDAHTEANVGWAEPLLQIIKDDPTVIVQPEVDQVEAWTLEYIGSKRTVPRGGWSWDLRYVWMEIPEHENRRLATVARAHGVHLETVPFRTAALVGCALAVQRDYFFRIGGFDEGMNVWGGENIELAMRNWLCGGKVLTQPCSRVAHTFKPFSYQFDGDREKIVEKNLMRIAELYMGEWKKFFYASTYSWLEKRTYFTEEEKQTLTERKKLRDKMGCKSFKWYMDNIYQDVPTPPMDSTWYGEVTNLRTEACLYVHDDGFLGMTYFCFFHRVLPKNQFHIDTNQRLMYDKYCVHIDFSTWLLFLGSCDDNPVNKPIAWEMTFNVNIHPLEGKLRATYNDPTQSGEPLRTQCLTQVTNVTPKHTQQQMPQLMDCDENNEFQRWRWQYHFDFNYNFEPPQPS